MHQMGTGVMSRPVEEGEEAMGDHKTTENQQEKEEDTMNKDTKIQENGTVEGCQVDADEGDDEGGTRSRPVNKSLGFDDTQKDWVEDGTWSGWLVG